MLGWAYIDTGRWDEALEAAAEAAGLAEANHMDIVAASADVITATVLAMRADSAAARTARRPGAGHRRPSRMRAGRRPGPACPRHRSPRRRQLPPSVHPAPRAVRRGRHAPAQLRLLPGRGRPRRRRGPRRPADGRTRRHRATHSAISTEWPLPGSSSSPPAPAASSPARPVRSLFRQGAFRPRRGPVAIRARPASPRPRRMATAAAPDQRRQTRTDARPWAPSGG